MPERFYPAGRPPARESWRTLFYANLIKRLPRRDHRRTRRRNQGNFDDGAWVQESDQRRRAVVPRAPLGERCRWHDAPAARLDRFFAHYYRRRPVKATFTGVHEHDRPAAGLVARRARRRGRRDARRCVASSTPPGASRTTARQAFPDEVDLALADGFLEIQIAEHESGHFAPRGNPSLWTGEAIFGVIALVTRDFAPLPSGWSRPPARCDAIPAFLRARGGRDPACAARRGAPRAIRECRRRRPLFGDSLPAWVECHGTGPGARVDCRRAAAARACGFDAGSGDRQPSLLSSRRTWLPDAPSERESRRRATCSRCC